MNPILLLSMFMLVFGTAKAQDQTEESRCIAQIVDTFKRLNVILVENHCPPLSFDPSHLKVFHPPDFIRKIKVLEFRTAEGIYVKFLPGSCALIEITRDDVSYDAEGPVYNRRPRAIWTEEEATAMAKNYATAVFGSFPKNVASPFVEFQTSGGGQKYLPGRWHIRWPRVDDEGHLFNIDALHVYLFEHQGLTSAALNFFSDYQEPKGRLISKEEALKIAGPAAQILTSKISGNLKLGSYEIEKIIINPNYIFQVKNVALFGTEARLTWNVTYQITSNGAPTEHQVHVAVDAQTKEAIDGDYH